MKERTGLVTLKGNPVTLLGDEVQVGRKAPGFQVVDNDLKPYIFEPGQGKITILASVPSLDTPVCDMETRRFNQEAAALGKDVGILTISMDLPFAQKRWCAAAGVENVKTLSDHREASFGLAYGLLIKEVRLLARAVLVLDKKGIVRHMELVKEVGREPDYTAVLEAVKALDILME
jgi:thioredoxin-dependent peroxiredoxin